ncbi:MAG: hypothetical protein GEU79_07880 [Acidimicrobiia bacterium]|nr:hypothetical protein [Acidimicrobiia bacterium]
MNTLGTEMLMMASSFAEIVRTRDWSVLHLDDDRGEDGGMSTVIIIAGLVAAALVIVGAIAAMANRFKGEVDGLNP